MKASILFLSSVLLLFSCSTKVDEKEIRFHQRLVNDKILEINRSFQFINKQLNNYQYKADTSILIGCAILNSKIDILLDSNKLKAAYEVLHKDLKNVDDEVINKKNQTIAELDYIDSLYNVSKDTITNLKFRSSIYNALNIVLISKIYALRYNCSFIPSVSVIYNTKEYKLSDTLEIMVMPGIFMYMNEGFLGSMFTEKVSAKYGNYTLAETKTKDTVNLIIQPMQNAALIYAVIKKKGNYILTGKFSVSNKTDTQEYFTKELIHIE